MASIRTLKKDINYITSVFVTDCYLTAELFPVEDSSVIEKLADKVIDARDELISIVYHPENKGMRFLHKDKEVLKTRNKAHKEVINTTFDTFMNIIDESYAELKTISKFE